MSYTANSIAKLKALKEGNALEPVASPTIPEGIRAQIPSQAPVRNPLLRDQLPIPFAQEPDQQRQFYGTPVPQNRTFAAPAAASISAGAASQSQATAVIEAGGGPLLQTDNVTNAKQNKLNLIAGANIELTADGQGNTTIVGTAGGDGLVHGDAIWETDSGYVALRDDFLRGGTASGAFGELRWGLNPAPTTPTYVTGAAPNLGGLVFSNTSVSNAIYGLFMTAEASTLFNQMAWDLLNSTNWKCTWIFKLDSTFTNSPSAGPAFSLAQTSFYIGLGYAQGAVSKGRPDIFVGLRYDTDTTAPAIRDTTLKFEVVVNPLISTSTRSNTQGTVVDTGITPVQGAFYRLDIQSTTVGVVTMSVNGSAPVTFTVPSATLVVTNGAVAAGFGVAEVSASSVTGGWVALPWASGTSMTVAGLGGGNAVLNGAHVIRNSGALVGIFGSSASIVNNNATPTFSGAPSLMPWLTFGNDTSASPVTSSKELYLDFFSFVWNPGVGGGTGTPLATKARYF